MVTRTMKKVTILRLSSMLLVTTILVSCQYAILTSHAFQSCRLLPIYSNAHPRGVVTWYGYFNSTETYIEFLQGSGNRTVYIGEVFRADPSMRDPINKWIHDQLTPSSNGLYYVTDDGQLTIFMCTI